MEDICTFFTHENDCPGLDTDAAVSRLSRAIQCRTVNDGGMTDYGEFDKLHRLIRGGYPHIASLGSFEVFGGRALLITLPGSDASLRPCLLMSHQDVVPVSAGSERDWTYPPFSGEVAGGYVWGRGTLDVKDQVFGCLEATEYLLSRGCRFARTVYLAFGDDEETRRAGAGALAKVLDGRGVRLEYVLDECGGKIQDAVDFGAPGTYLSPVGIMEKGYIDLELSVKSGGGHAARPFGGTSLGKLSRAIANAAYHPFPPRLSPVMVRMFRSLSPYITQEPLRTLVEDIEGNADEIARLCSAVPALFPFVTTTIAPTVIRGGSAVSNVLPRDMSAVINLRLIEGDTVEGVWQHLAEAVNDPEVTMRILKADGPSSEAGTDSWGYAHVVKSMGRYFKNVVFVPALITGATDARNYERICSTCLRCSPFMAPPEDVARGVHGTDERISLRAYAQGIRVLIHLLWETAAAPGGCGCMDHR